jgi:hyperosmotically inducible protein
MKLRSIYSAVVLGVAVSVSAVAGAQAPATAGPSANEAVQKSEIKDGWITFKVHSLFVPEDVLEGSNIDVDTEKGVVTLSGTVPSAAAKTRAVAIAKATDGVKGVTDRLVIGKAEQALDEKMLRDAGRKTGRTVTDGWVKSKIHAEFMPEKLLDDSDIDVDIKAGAVTLNGTVKTEAGRARAAAIAKGVSGVKSVTNNLKIG